MDKIDVLRYYVIQAVQTCTDEALLDLVWKLLIVESVATA